MANEKTIHIPDMDKLADVYKKAINSSDRNLAGIVEQAVLQFAIAESGVHEGKMLADFALKASS